MSATGDILDQIDDAIQDWSVGPDAMRSGAPDGAGLASMPSPPTINPESLRRVSVRISAAMEGFKREMAKVAVAVARMLETNEGLRRALGLPIYDQHHPRPLCIDGTAYRRKSKARRRRK
jgi:hypothetical protein